MKYAKNLFYAILILISIPFVSIVFAIANIPYVTVNGCKGYSLKITDEDK